MIGMVEDDDMEPATLLEQARYAGTGQGHGWSAMEREFGALILELQAENALLLKALQDAPHGQDCHSVRRRHLPGGFEGAGCPDSHWTNGPCDCWKAALARIPEAKPQQ